MSDTSDTDQDTMVEERAEHMEAQQMSQATPGKAPQAAASDEMERAQFQNLKDEGVAGVEDDKNMDMILDIPVNLSVEIGRTKISIRNLLKLNQGSVVELSRLAGEPMDIYVNGTLIAHGEVVVVNDKFGIRLTDVISAAERVKKLK